MFDWDEEKNTANIEKHGIDFEDVIPVFFSRQALIVQDNRKDYGEDRFIVLCLLGGRML
ncbi:MAG: BrnT family toxin, partial [Geminicoccales bacterium]